MTIHAHVSYRKERLMTRLLAAVIAAVCLHASLAADPAAWTLGCINVRTTADEDVPLDEGQIKMLAAHLDSKNVQDLYAALNEVWSHAGCPDVASQLRAQGIVGKIKRIDSKHETAKSLAPYAEDVLWLIDVTGMSADKKVSALSDALADRYPSRSIRALTLLADIGTDEAKTVIQNAGKRFSEQSWPDWTARAEQALIRCELGRRTAELKDSAARVAVLSDALGKVLSAKQTTGSAALAIWILKQLAAIGDEPALRALEDVYRDKTLDARGGSQGGDCRLVAQELLVKCGRVAPQNRLIRSFPCK